MVKERRINHRGSHGLFDDMDEGTEVHELHQTDKEARMAERIARGKPAESKLTHLFAKVLHRSDKKEGFDRLDNEKKDLPKGFTIAVNGQVMSGEAPMYQNAGEIPGMYRNRGWDTGAVESLWLKECGMIRVKSDNPGGCHIMAKPFILRDS